jgi:DNA gyrase subunit B
MYIGSTGERGLHHLVQEVVDNAVDEALAGYCDLIVVTLLADGGVRVVDNGRGIPVDIHPKLKKSGIEVALTMLHAGGKFEGKAYTVSGGLHGVGVSVVNALSVRMEIEIHKDGYVWRQQYTNSRPGPLEKGETTRKTGSSVAFWPDGSIFETTDFNFETIYRRLQEMAFLNRGLTIALRDERVGGEAATEDRREVTFCYKGGISDFVRHLNQTKTPITSPWWSSAPRARACRSRSRCSGTSRTARACTRSPTPSTRTRAAPTRRASARADHGGEQVRHDKKFLKGDDKLTGEDIREGLAAIVSVKLTNPQFEGQTKTKLGNTDMKGFVQKVCNEWLVDWFERNPSEAKTIITKASAAARAAVAAAQARRLARRKSLLESGSMPGKLADCQSTDPRVSELFIVEGDSAGGSAKQGRDPKTQAILPIRGKILNVEKARIDRVLKNNEVQSLITALGTGIHEEFDIEKLRYHKIILMADADVDGQHIQTLLLTLLFRFMRPLVELGHVYLAAPPLYKIKWNKKGDDSQYAYSDRERDGLIALPAGEAAERQAGRHPAVQGPGRDELPGALGDHHEPGHPDPAPGDAGRRGNRG